MRIPSTEKAKRILGFEASTTLDDVLDEVVSWVRSQIDAGAI
jgi:nucleoside-diphosphate-sugar epimerase